MGVSMRFFLLGGRGSADCLVWSFQTMNDEMELWDCQWCFIPLSYCWNCIIMPVFEGRKGASSKILFFLYLNFSKMFVAIKGNGSLPPDSSWCYSPEYHLYLSKKMLKDIIQVFFVTVYWLGIEISNSLTGYRTGLVEKMADRRRRKNSEAESEEDSRNEQTHGVWNNYSIYNFIWL